MSTRVLPPVRRVLPPVRQRPSLTLRRGPALRMTTTGEKRNSSVVEAVPDDKRRASGTACRQAGCLPPFRSTLRPLSVVGPGRRAIDLWGLCLHRSDRAHPAGCDRGSRAYAPQMHVAALFMSGNTAGGRVRCAPHKVGGLHTPMRRGRSSGGTQRRRVTAPSPGWSCLLR
jgi:hypothetical protein